MISWVRRSIYALDGTPLELHADKLGAWLVVNANQSVALAGPLSFESAQKTAERIARERGWL